MNLNFLAPICKLFFVPRSFRVEDVDSLLDNDAIQYYSSSFAKATIKQFNSAQP
jgi:hypothetical protein